MEIREAFYDIIFGAKNFQFWTVFATNDVKSKYRRSKLGQGWITLSVAIFLVVIGSLSKLSIMNFIPALAAKYGFFFRTVHLVLRINPSSTPRYKNRGLHQSLPSTGIRRSCYCSSFSLLPFVFCAGILAELQHCF